jgi:4-amino-4-deoxy-L-arabinose transferase-like glycosyltransferase
LPGSPSGYRWGASSLTAIARDYTLLWALLVAVGLVCRPLIPVDETRAVAVAWEMWLRGDPLVPHLNGSIYSHKPPLLQWGINLGWLVAGVNDWTPRLVAPLFGLVNLYLTAAVGRRLWPEQPEVSRLAPLVLLSFPLWSVWTTLTLYDMLVAFFALLGMLGIAWRATGRRLGGVVLTGIAVGGGVLAKGPVILVFILPLGIAAPLWIPSAPAGGWVRWCLDLLVALSVGAAMALAWALPAGFAGGEAYRQAIFWGQSAGRITESFAHRRDWWWYGAVLPVVLFPWIWRVSIWRGRGFRRLAEEWGFKFCLVQGLGAFLLLSAISGKQIHYLLPLIPGAALVLARLFGGADRRWIAVDQWVIGGVFLFAGAVLLLAQQAGSRLPGDLSWIAPAIPLASKLGIFGVGCFLCMQRHRTPLLVARYTAYALVAAMAAGHYAYRDAKAAMDDVTPVAVRVGELQRLGVPIAHWGKYSGDFQFPGRLKTPLETILDRMDLESWLAAYPNGYVVIEFRAGQSIPESSAAYVQAYRTARRRVGLWRASTLSQQPLLMEQLIK